MSEELRIERLPLEANPPAVQDVFRRFLEERGNVPNMFRIMGRLPDHLDTMIEHFATVMAEREVPRRLKEMVSIRVSAINGCRY